MRRSMHPARAKSMRLYSEIGEHSEEINNAIASIVSVEEVAQDIRDLKIYRTSFSALLKMMLFYVLAMGALIQICSVLDNSESNKAPGAAILMAACIFALFHSLIAPLGLEKILRQRPVSSITAFTLVVPYYFLIIFAFAVVYSLMGNPDQDHFKAGMSSSDALYYSAVTVTTLGFGDITPISGAAKSLAAMESVLGISFFLFALLGATLLVDHQLKAESRISANVSKNSERVRNEINCILEDAGKSELMEKKRLIRAYADNAIRRYFDETVVKNVENHDQEEI